MLKQEKRSVDEYYKEMELLLVRARIRENPKLKMTRFLGGLNEEISSFVEMFPYHTLQDLIDQAIRTERKIQQETRGRSYASHSIAAPWRKQQSGTSFGGVGPRCCSKVLSIHCSFEDGGFYSIITCKPTTACCKYGSPNYCFSCYFLYT
jgi:hypothetical protein